MTMIVLGILLAINVIAFLLFGWDKHCAVTNRRRVSESNLLMISLLGGAFGAIAGQQFFRTKRARSRFVARST